jgi:predicted signal transduction protein with EAL and GGDEF domain
LFSKPFELDNATVVVGASIGIAQAPTDSVDPNELLKLADAALYATKAEGRNGFNFFHPRMLANIHDRHRLERELREAIERSEFELHYQPILDAASGYPYGAEALIRWRHPTEGLLGPDRFIPMAESCGLIIPIGEWVLRKACKDASEWPVPMRVAVNLSPAQLKRNGIVEVVLSALGESGLCPTRLELEITETALINNTAECASLMEELRHLGISISVDDFGTGYSSLSYLTMFPFDKIKIDRTFVQNLTKRADYAAIVSAVLTLGSGLSMKTVAEGVETEQQFYILRSAGVDFVQGYLFGPPRPVGELRFSPWSFPATTEAMIVTDLKKAS